MCMILLFSAWARGKGFFKMVGPCLCRRRVAPPLPAALSVLLWEKAEVKIWEGLRQLPFQRNLMCLKLIASSDASKNGMVWHS